MKKEQKLRQLAQYLRKMPAKKFDFGTWMEKKPGCGTVCCAAGWIPKAFAKIPAVAPAAAKVWFKYGRGWSYTFNEDHAKRFMNFSTSLFTYCFIPSSLEGSGNGLSSESSKEEVADHLDNVARQIKKGEWRGHNYIG
jgi:hypothetical protein